MCSTQSIDYNTSAPTVSAFKQPDGQATDEKRQDDRVCSAFQGALDLLEPQDD